MNLHDFDAIRPVEPNELPAAFDALLADATFCTIMQSFFKDVPFEVLKRQLYACQDNLQVQRTFFLPLIQNLLQQASTGIDMDTSALEGAERLQPHTYISNHRDIVLDSALLDVLLIGEGFDKTVEIAIGDNLLLQPWIKTLVRVNKSFIVQRSVGLREMLASSKRLSEYMHFAIAEKQQPIWIAQREGRAKDSDDRTQESLLKMMTMGGEGTPLQRLKSLHIVPLTISYEYDPCDFLKAQEFQQKRDNPDFRKSGQDDLDNMQTGIFGYKGKIHYHMARPANTWLDELEGLPKAEFYAEAARRIDREIHSHYALLANNYAALDLLEGTHRFAAHYTAEELARFEQYLEAQMQKIQLPQGSDRDFLRERMLTMYANPLRNYLAAVQ